MLKVNDYVRYGAKGIFQIVEIQKRRDKNIVYTNMLVGLLIGIGVLAVFLFYSKQYIIFFNSDYSVLKNFTIYSMINIFYSYVLRLILEKLYYEKYADEYDLYIIDYQNDHEYNFISTYNLSQPLEVVLVRIQDGSSFGYEKIENLQNRIYDKIAFDDYIEYRINSFLRN